VRGGKKEGAKESRGGMVKKVKSGWKDGEGGVEGKKKQVR